MNHETKTAAEKESLRTAVLDLEALVKNQNRVLYAFLGIAVFFGLLALWLLYRLDTMNVLSILAS